MVAVWGARPLDQISASDIEAMQHHMVGTARSRRNSRHGRHAGEHVIAAARAIYNRAIADGLIEANASPAHRVAMSRPMARPLSRLTAPLRDWSRLDVAFAPIGLVWRTASPTRHLPNPRPCVRED